MKKILLGLFIICYSLLLSNFYLKAKANSFIRPNIEIITYQQQKNSNNYVLDGIAGIYGGYSDEQFEIEAGANYIALQKYLMINFGSAYKLSLNIVDFLFGGELGFGYNLDRNACTECGINFLITPRAGFNFNIGETMVLGANGKVYFSFSSQLPKIIYSAGLILSFKF